MNFMKLICENAVTEHSVTFYADYLCVSTKHLTRLTKETFKQTPHEMICKKKSFIMLWTCWIIMR